MAACASLSLSSTLLISCRIPGSDLNKLNPWRNPSCLGKVCPNRIVLVPLAAGLGEGRDVGHGVDLVGDSANSLADDMGQKEIELTPTSATGQVGSVLSFLCPLLKLVGGGDPSAPRNAFLEEVMSGVATIARLPWGSKVLPEITASGKDRKQPHKALQLFEFEACPFCRRVREALTELDLEVEIYPCPKGSIRHREIVRKTGGKDQFPFLVDPNSGVSMYESGDIVNYLFKTYGEGSALSLGLLESTFFTGWVPTIIRAGRGMTLWERASPEQPQKKLELFSYENNQFARIVREALCELELPYVLHNVGIGSSNTTKLHQLSGSTNVPFLIDPNTGVHLGNYQEIILHLFKTYGSSNTAHNVI